MSPSERPAADATDPAELEEQARTLGRDIDAMDRPDRAILLLSDKEPEGVGPVTGPAP
jgi:hypothetical protein